MNNLDSKSKIEIEKKKSKKKSNKNKKRRRPYPHEKWKCFEVQAEKDEKINSPIEQANDHDVIPSADTKCTSVDREGQHHARIE